jgi:hypothetical protein
MTDSNSNLSLWNDLEKTDPEYTKGFNRAGGFKGTAINAMYAIKKMTEKFGPMGKGWGIEVENERIEECGDEKLVFVQVALWWAEIVDDKRYKHIVGPQWGGDKLRSTRSGGNAFNDDEALKKATTDAMLKCMSYLGIGADLHLGLYDDNKYVANAEREFTGASTMPDKRPERPTRTKQGADATPVGSGSVKPDVGMTKLPPVDTAAESAAEIAELQHKVDEGWGIIQTHLLKKHSGDIKAAKEEVKKAAADWLNGVDTKDLKAKLMATRVGQAHYIAELAGAAQGKPAGE